MNRTTRTRAAALVLAVGGAGLAAGCGGSDTASSTTTAATAPTVATSTARVETLSVGTVPSTPSLPTTPTTPVTGATAPTTAQSPETPGGTVSPAAFVTDVQAFAQTLTRFGLTLQAAAEGPEALRARSAAMRSQLDDLDTIVARMGSYRVEASVLEERRAAIVAASPDVSRLGRELLAAAEAGDSQRVQQVAQEFTGALKRLQTAAGG